jgi:hypothetical protein
VKVEIQAGAKMDIVTPAEMHAALRGFMAELVRSKKYRRAGGQATAAGGAWSIPGQANGMGPMPGFTWSVTNIAVQGGAYTLGTDTFNVYFDANSGLAVVNTGVSRVDKYNPGALVLNPGDSLFVQGTAAGAGTDVGVTLLVIEEPVQLKDQLS